MSTTTNYPSATPQSQPPKKDYKNLVIGLLAAGFLGTWGYLLWNNNKQEQVQTQQQAQISKVSDEKGQLQKNFDDALVRLDSLTGTNNKLTSQVNEGNGQIAKLKSNIRGLLNKQHLTEAEKKKAEDLIKDLNDKIGNLEQQVAQLTQDNQQLTADKTQLTADKDKLTTDLSSTTAAKQDLEKKVDVASTLNASNITISPMHERKDGKDKETTTARKVNKLGLLSTYPIVLLRLVRPMCMYASPALMASRSPYLPWAADLSLPAMTATSCIPPRYRLISNPERANPFSSPGNRTANSQRVTTRSRSITMDSRSVKAPAR